jgi:2-polyprenyl-3-methyl-5-hydroxy-6-metoxy-1,4-benzoquinol methylase
VGVQFNPVWSRPNNYLHGRKFEMAITENENGMNIPVKAPIENYHNLIRRDVFPLLSAKVGRVLDIGGGIGATSSALKVERGASHVVVADQVADHVAAGVDQAFAGDLEDETFLRKVLDETGPFDTILALDILEHLRDPWNVVRLLHSALAPRGMIVASIPNVNYHGLLAPLVLRGRYELTDSGILDRTHIRWFAKHGALELMSCSGLEVDAVVPNIFGRKSELFTKMSRGRLTRFTALQYLIRARQVDHTPSNPTHAADKTQNG